MVICFAGRRQEINMFTVEHRDHVRHRVLELARGDPRVTAGALTGSMALGSGDRWSDIDVAFGIVDGITPEAVLADWTQVLEREFSVLDHFDLRSGSSVYRVFLLPGGLEVDVAVIPGEGFGAPGPHFRALFRPTRPLHAATQPSPSSLIGLGWEHILHPPSSSLSSRGEVAAEAILLGISTLVCCGCNFPNCPRTSLYEASERDFRLVFCRCPH